MENEQTANIPNPKKTAVPQGAAIPLAQNHGKRNLAWHQARIHMATHSRAQLLVIKCSTARVT